MNQGNTSSLIKDEILEELLCTFPKICVTPLPPMSIEIGDLSIPEFKPHFTLPTSFSKTINDQTCKFYSPTKGENILIKNILNHNENIELNVIQTLAVEQCLKDILSDLDHDENSGSESLVSFQYGTQRSNEINHKLPVYSHGSSSLNTDGIKTTPSITNRKQDSSFVFSLKPQLCVINRSETKCIFSLNVFIDIMEALSSQERFYSEELSEKLKAIDSEEHYLDVDERTLTRLRDQLSKLIIQIVAAHKPKDSPRCVDRTEGYRQFLLATSSVAIRTLQKLIQKSKIVSEEYFIQCCDLLVIIFSIYTHNLGTFQYHKLHDLLVLFNESLLFIKIPDNIVSANIKTFLQICVSESMTPLRAEILSLVSKLISICQSHQSLLIEDLSKFLIYQRDNIIPASNACFHLPYELLYSILKKELYSSPVDSYDKLTIEKLGVIIRSFVLPFLNRISDKHLSISTLFTHLLQNSIQSLFTKHDPIDLLIIHHILYNLFTIIETLKSSDSEVLTHILDILIDIGQALNSTNIDVIESYTELLHTVISKSNINIHSIHILIYESSCLLNIQSDDHLKLLDKDSTFINDSATILNQLFIQLLNPIILGLVSALLSLSSNPTATTRSKSIRGLTNIFPFICKSTHPNLHQLLHACIKCRLHDDSCLTRDASLEFLSKNHMLFKPQYSLFSFQDDIFSGLSDSSILVKKRCIKLLLDLYESPNSNKIMITSFLLQCLLDKEVIIREIAQSTMSKCFMMHNATDFDILSNMLCTNLSAIDDQMSRDHIISFILSTPESFLSSFIDYLVNQSIIFDLNSCCLLDILTSTTNSIQPRHTMMLIQHLDGMRSHQTLYHILNILVHTLPYITTLSGSTCKDLEKTLFSMLTRSPDFIIDPVIHLIGILIRKNLSNADLIENLWTKLYEVVAKYTTTGSIPIPMVSRSIYICSLITRYISNTSEVLSERSNGLVDIIVLLYKETNMLGACIYSLGNVLLNSPKLVLSDNVKQVIEYALTNANQVACLSLLCKVMTQIGSVSTDEASSGDMDPSSVAAAIAQMYYPLMLSCVTTRDLQVQSAAIKLLNVFFSFGLLHPGLVSPYYIFIEAINNGHLTNISKETLSVLREKHSGFACSRVKDAIVLLYEYLKPHNGFFTQEESRISLFQSHFMAIRSKKPFKTEFFRTLSTFFEWSDNALLSRSAYNDMHFLKFVIEIIGYLVLKTEEEVILLLNILIKVMISSGHIILNMLYSNDADQIRQVAQSLLWINELISFIKDSYDITDKYYSSIMEGNKKQIVERQVQKVSLVMNLGYDELLDTDTLIDKLEDIVHEQVISDEEYRESVTSKKKKKGKPSTKGRKGKMSMVVEDEKSSSEQDEIY